MEIINYVGDFVYGGMSRLFNSGDDSYFPLEDMHLHYTLEVDKIHNQVVLTIKDSLDNVYDVYNNIVSESIIKEFLSIIKESFTAGKYELANGQYCDFLPYNHTLTFDEGNTTLNFASTNRFPNNKRLKLLLNAMLTRHINNNAYFNLDDLML